MKSRFVPFATPETSKRPGTLTSILDNLSLPIFRTLLFLDNTCDFFPFKKMLLFIVTISLLLIKTIITNVIITVVIIAITNRFDSTLLFSTQVAFCLAVKWTWITSSSTHDELKTFK